MTDSARSGRRVPAWFALGLDWVRAAREGIRLFLRSLGWRARCRTTQSLYLGRRARRPGGSRRSVLFLHHSYYHFYYLAKALRARGWDALCVSVEDPGGAHRLYYHGEDLNLFSAHRPLYRYTQSQLQYNVREFFNHACKRFAMMHFSGDGHMSFFPDNWGWDGDVPWDMVEWRRSGKKIAYTVSGCNSGVAQSSVASWSRDGDGRPVCDKCVWQRHPDICSDAKNLRWGQTVTRLCDLVFAEGLPALDHLSGPGVIREPMTTCLDPDVWSPDLRVPEHLRLPRAPGELLVFHAVGNYHARTMGGRNIKGTRAVVETIERLQREGVRVRLIHPQEMPNTEVRFLQAQCDVIVDQLNFGRYGAIAREGMMLGKPTICYIKAEEPPGVQTLSCLQEVPLVSAMEETVFEALKGLLGDAARRESIGKASRAYALKWHGADACAARYEVLYDVVMTGRGEATGGDGRGPEIEKRIEPLVGASRS